MTRVSYTDRRDKRKQAAGTCHRANEEEIYVRYNSTEMMMSRMINYNDENEKEDQHKANNKLTGNDDAEIQHGTQRQAVSNSCSITKGSRVSAATPKKKN